MGNDIKKLCPMCGNKLWQDYYNGFWHCSHCPYWGNPGHDEFIATDHTEEE